MFGKIAAIATQTLSSCDPGFPPVMPPKTVAAAIKDVNTDFVKKALAGAQKPQVYAWSGVLRISAHGQDIAQ